METARKLDDCCSTLQIFIFRLIVPQIILVQTPLNDAKEAHPAFQSQDKYDELLLDNPLPYSTKIFEQQLNDLLAVLYLGVEFDHHFYEYDPDYLDFNNLSEEEKKKIPDIVVGYYDFFSQFHY